MKYKIYVLSLLFALSSCNTQTAVATPTSTPIPTETLAPPTQTSTPTETPTPTPPDIATPETSGEGMVTYKNAEGNEVTVELGTYSYTNNKGEVVEVLQSSDRLALLKSFADLSKWYPAGTESPESFGSDKNFVDLLAQYDVSWPPQNRKTWRSSMPEIAGSPFMSIFQTGWEGGTLILARKEDGTYLVRFYPDGDPNDFDDPTWTPQSAEYQYLLELAAEHQ